MPGLINKIYATIKGWSHRYQKRNRHQIIAFLRALPISSKIIGPPKGLYITAREWSYSAGSLDSLKEIYPKHSNHRTAPVTQDGNIPWEFHTFFDGMMNNEDAAYIVSIPKGRIYGEGAIITPDDRLVGDISREFLPRNDQHKHSVFSQLKLPKLSRIGGTVAVLAVQSADVYWHWMFDLLPRIHLLARSGISSDQIDYYVINTIKHPYQKESLEQVGLPKSKIIDCNKHTHLVADSLLVPSINQRVPSKWSCNYVRDLFLTPDKTRSHKQGKRLYVTRSDARIRRVTNEYELSGLLAEHGFETITLTGKSVADQASLFASADVVLAPHGSGLTNILFCRPGTKLIELFNPMYVNPCYWVLSNTIGLEYYFQLGRGKRPPTPPEGMDNRRWWSEHLRLGKHNGNDIFIDIDSLSKFLRQILSDKNITALEPQ